MLEKLTLSGAYNLYNNYKIIVQIKNGKVILAQEEDD